MNFFDQNMPHIYCKITDKNVYILSIPIQYIWFVRVSDSKSRRYTKYQNNECKKSSK